MRILSLATGLAVILVAATPSLAEPMRSKVAFNTGVQKPAANQPAGGMAVTWDVKLSGGELDGCTANLLDHLFPRDNGSWGIFELEGNVACDKGTFKFTTTGAWDKNGFHGAGLHKQGWAQRGVREGRRTGRADRRKFCASGNGRDVRCLV